MLENAIVRAPSHPHRRTTRPSLSQRSIGPTVAPGAPPNRPALRLARRPDGVEAAVHVDDLAADRPRIIREQKADRVGHRPWVLDVPAERRLLTPQRGQRLEPGDSARRNRAERPRRDEVHPDPAGPEVPR